MENTIKKTHPLILIAAASVTALSLAATAHLMGWLPGSGTPESPAQVLSAAPTPELPPIPLAPQQTATEATSTTSPPPVIDTPPKPAPKPTHKPAPVSTKKESTTVVQESPQDQKASPYSQGNSSSGNTLPPPAPQICHQCGVVEHVKEIKAPGEASGLGAVAGGVLGGVLGHQVGGGTGKKVATVAGVVGGAYAGHQIEKSTRTSSSYEISVRMDDGSRRVFTEHTAPAWRNGDQVRVNNGQLTYR